MASTLFPEGRGGGEAIESLRLTESGVTFEWNCPESLARQLRLAGLNVLASHTPRETLLRDIVPFQIVVRNANLAHRSYASGPGVRQVWAVWRCRLDWA
jgi:hypothetical protein